MRIRSKWIFEGLIFLRMASDIATPIYQLQFCRVKFLRVKANTQKQRKFHHSKFTRYTLTFFKA